MKICVVSHLKWIVRIGKGTQCCLCWRNAQQLKQSILFTSDRSVEHINAYGFHLMENENGIHAVTHRHTHEYAELDIRTHADMHMPSPLILCLCLWKWKNWSLFRFMSFFSVCCQLCAHFRHDLCFCAGVGMKIHVLKIDFCHFYYFIRFRSVSFVNMCVHWMYGIIGRLVLNKM